MNRNWEQFGEDIRRTVQNAIDNNDFDELSYIVKERINQVVDTVADGVKSAADYTKQTAGEERQAQRERYEAVKAVIQIPSRGGAIGMMAFGYGAGLLFLLSLFGKLAAGLLFQTLLGAGTGFFSQSISIFMGIFATVSFIIGIAGTKKLKKINRGRKYVSLMGDKTYCNISDFAKAVGKNNKFVVKDLESMIKKGWFKEGHLDNNKSCLMITDRMYEEYCRLEEQKSLAEKEKKAKEEEARKRAADMEASRSHLLPEVRKVIEEGENYIKEIRKCNDAIPGKEISEKIDRIELLTVNIFERVEQEPKCISDIEKLMSYYLPTTVKLLTAYAQMDAQPVGGENITNAKREIENTLDTLNTAFEKLLDSLFMEKAWDVSTDISVLNTILAQEGLTEDGLRAKK